MIDLDHSSSRCTACLRDDAWHALLAAALTARPRLTAAIDAAVEHALRAEQAEPGEACLGLAHVIAAQAARAEDPAALLCAAFRMAALVAAPGRGIDLREGTP